MKVDVNVAKFISKLLLEQLLVKDSEVFHLADCGSDLEVLVSPVRRRTMERHLEANHLPQLILRHGLSPDIFVDTQPELRFLFLS